MADLLASICVSAVHHRPYVCRGHHRERSRADGRGARATSGPGAASSPEARVFHRDHLHQLWRASGGEPGARPAVFRDCPIPVPVPVPVLAHLRRSPARAAGRLLCGAKREQIATLPILVRSVRLQYARTGLELLLSGLSTCSA